MERTRRERTLDDIKGKDKKKILFVCLGNICRSPAAEGVLQNLVEESGATSSWEIDSAGTGGWHVGELPDKRMRIHAAKRGLELNHHCRRVSRSDFDDFDLIIGMDSMNISDLKSLAPTMEAEEKIFPMAYFVDKAMRYDHIPDPYYEGAQGFELVLDLLQNGCENLYNRLK